MWQEQRAAEQKSITKFALIRSEPEVQLYHLLCVVCSKVGSDSLTFYLMGKTNYIIRFMKELSKMKYVKRLHIKAEISINVRYCYSMFYY